MEAVGGIENVTAAAAWHKDEVVGDGVTRRWHRRRGRWRWWQLQGSEAAQWRCDGGPIDDALAVIWGSRPSFFILVKFWDRSCNRLPGVNSVSFYAMVGHIAPGMSVVED